MERDIRLIKNTLEDMSYNNLKKFDENYYCRKEIKLMNELKNGENIIQKFLFSYLGKVKYFCELDKEYSELFIKWYNEKGKDNFKPLLGEIDYEKIKINSLIKTITRYEILLQQSVREKNIDSLLNLLIDSSKNIYGKLLDWGCLVLKRKMTCVFQFWRAYESNRTEKYNFDTSIPAEMQVSLL